MNLAITVSAVCLFDLEGRLLTVRKTGTSKFMQPGGKPEIGESAAEAASRELFEEIGIRVAPEDLQLLGSWQGPAANEAGASLDAQVFLAPGRWEASTIKAAAEIAELRWIELNESANDFAPLLSDYILPLLRQRFE